MQQFWSWLAVQLGKRAGLVAVVGLLVTLILGYGTTKLTFATGQDSYLNSDDQVYKENVDYQNLFGGEAMLVLLSADQGKNVVDLMSPANQAKYDTLATELKAHPDLVQNVITPKTALEWTNNLVLGTTNQTDPSAPVTSVAGKALLAAQGTYDPATCKDEAPPPPGEPVTVALTCAEKKARAEDTQKTLARLGTIPPEERTLANPKWVDFLLHDNTGQIRKALRPVFTDENHAQLIVRLPGNASIDQGGAGSDLVQQAAAKLQPEGARVTVTGAPVLLKQINDYLRGGMMTLGLIAIAIMALILILLFDVRWRLLPLGVILVGVI